MSRSWYIVAVTLPLAATLAVIQLRTHWTADQVTDREPLEATAGRVQLVIDEQDVGLVRQGAPLEVQFTLSNTGTERLVLRQAPRECCSGESLPKFTIEPGQMGEVVARLSADELLARGRKNLRFFTSDARNPELWVTVRGTVVRRPAASEEDVD